MESGEGGRSGKGHEVEVRSVAEVGFLPLRGWEMRPDAQRRSWSDREIKEYCGRIGINCTIAKTDEERETNGEETCVKKIGEFVFDEEIQKQFKIIDIPIPELIAEIEGGSIDEIDGLSPSI
jgi:hypothetical protein